jgi:hypothetical protein
VLNVKAQFDPAGSSPSATNASHNAAGDTATWTKFSYHALKFFAKGRYTTSAVTAGVVPATLTSIGGFTASTNCAGAACNDTSQMYCSDCHRSTYNSHGSKNAEYMLKCAVGGTGCTAESSDALGSEANGGSVCFRCHPSGRYSGGGGHAPGGGCNVEVAGSTAAVRNAGDGNLFFLSCLHCHGGTDFGAIHGSSETITPVANQSAYNRKAWRFMNGASHSEWRSNNATATSDTGQPSADNTRWFGNAGTRTWECYTVGSAPDRSPLYGSCNNHGSGGKTMTGANRPLNY